MAEPVHGSAADPWGGWSWREPMRGAHFRTCSYCGSIYPDDLAVEFERGAQADWADQKYGWPHKFYVQVTNREPDGLFVLGSSTHESDNYRAWKDLTRAERKAVRRDGHGKDSYYLLGQRPTHFAKFYTAHLADGALSDETRAAIERGCGRVFTFEDGTVRWRAAGEGATDAH